MSTIKKLGMSLVWLGVYGTSIGLISEVRHIGTTWVDTAGGLRVLVLGILSIGTVIPLGFAALVWCDRPKWLYVRQH